MPTQLGWQRYKLRIRMHWLVRGEQGARRGAYGRSQLTECVGAAIQSILSPPNLPSLPPVKQHRPSCHS